MGSDKTFHLFLTIQTLGVLASRSSSRNEAITEAYATGSYSYQEIADYYGLHFTTVGIIARKARTGKSRVFKTLCQPNQLTG